MTIKPDYLAVPSDQLGRGTPVRVRTLGDMASIAHDLSQVMLDEIVAGQERGRPATFIVPVGPVDQYPILAQAINEQRIDCREVMFINMDEYLTDAGDWIDAEHPLSFRGYMQRVFYDRVNPELSPRAENRVFPHPARCAEIQSLIERRGGCDVCFGGIGINGHIAFNEPPEPGEEMSAEAFAKLSTRSLKLTSRNPHDQLGDRRRGDRADPQAGHHGGHERVPGIEKAAVLLQSTLAKRGRAARAAWSGHEPVPRVAPAHARRRDDNGCGLRGAGA